MSDKLRQALERILRYIELDAYVRSVCAQDCDQNKLRELYRSPSIKDLASCALDEHDAPGDSRHGVPDGFALVPLRMTRAMNRVVEEEGWQWGDLLAAAEAITDEQYNEVAATPTPVMAPIGKDGSTAAWPGIDYTRDEYARPDLAPNWIPWIGGAGTPASPATEVCVKYRDGTEMKTSRQVRSYAWYWTNEDDDIVAYRIIKS